MSKAQPLASSSSSVSSTSEQGNLHDQLLDLDAIITCLLKDGKGRIPESQEEDEEKSLDMAAHSSGTAVTTDINDVLKQLSSTATPSTMVTSAGGTRENDINSPLSLDQLFASVSQSDPQTTAVGSLSKPCNWATPTTLPKPTMAQHSLASLFEHVCPPMLYLYRDCPYSAFARV